MVFLIINSVASDQEKRTHVVFKGYSSRRHKVDKFQFRSDEKKGKGGKNVVLVLNFVVFLIFALKRKFTSSIITLAFPQKAQPVVFFF
jgi:hypothetical protein